MPSSRQAKLVAKSPENWMWESQFSANAGENEKKNTRVFLAVHRQLDFMALTEIFRRLPTCHLVSSTYRIEDCQSECCVHQPEVAILDTSFPRDEAFEAARVILSNNYSKYVLFLDEKTRLSHVQEALSLERSGYVTREFSAIDIQNAINDLVRGRTVILISPERRIRVDTSSHGLKLFSEQPSLINLTRREREVLKFIAAGLTNKEVAEKLELAESTVDNHRSRLMKKLNVHKISQLTQIAMREGLID